MRILICSIVDLEQSSNNRLHNIINHLKIHHEVIVVSIADHWKKNQDKHQIFQEDSLKTIRGVKIIHFTEKKISPIFQELFSLLTLPFVIRKFKLQSIDCFINYNSIISGWFLTLYYKKRGIKILFDLADDLVGLIKESPQIPAFLRFFAGIFGKFFVNYNIRNSSIITVTAQSLSKYLKIDKLDKTVIIPNGVDVKHFERVIPNHGLRGSLRLDRNFVVGYVGALREWIDFGPLFLAVKRLIQEGKNMKIVIAGKEGYYQENIALAKDVGLRVNKDIYFLGSCSYNDVPGVMKIFHAGVIPFKNNRITQNSLPLKLFEYGACGISIISTPLQEVRTIASDEILYAEKESEYFDILSQLYNEYQSGAASLSKNYGFIKCYDWSCIGDQYNALINENKQI